MNYEKLPKIKRLEDLPNPPKELFYQGEFNSEIFENCVAVVGSRRMTDYGRRVIEKLIPQLYKALDKTAKVGIIKKNNASRKKSRIAKLINKNLKS